MIDEERYQRHRHTTILVLSGGITPTSSMPMELTLTGATLASGGSSSGSTSSSPSKAAHQHGPGCSHDHSHSHSPHVAGGAAAHHASQTSSIRIRLPTHHTLPPEVLRRQLVQLSTNPAALFMALVGTVKVGSYESFVAFADGVRELEKERGAPMTILAERGGDGHTLCHWAAKRSDDVSFLEYFASVPGVDVHCPSTDSVGMYPIHWAATEGSIALVAFLLRHLTGSGGTSSNNEDIINARDGSGCTPLLIASQYGHADLAAFLLKRGADGSAVDSSSDTALHWAAYKGSVPVCGLLLHLHGVGGHIDNIDDFGQTPLHLAAMRGNVEVVQYLLEEAEAYMDRQARGEVPMSSPAHVGGRDSSFAGYLLTVQDKDGKTALDLAIKKKKEGSEMVLRDYINRHCAPRPNAFTVAQRACMEMFSPKAWKVWMGMNPEAASGAQSPKFPFYFVIGNMIVAFLYYPLVFVPMWTTSEDPGLLYDLMSVHIFSLLCQIIMWVSFVMTWKTDPGTLGTINSVSASDFTARGQAYALSCGMDQSTEIRSELDGITRVLRRKYDETLEEYSADATITKKSSEGGTTSPKPKKDHAALCHSCHIAKPLRSKHCRVARRCVLLFDHHCPFVGATIGLYNYKFFYTFLVTLVFALLTFIGTLIVFTLRSPKVHLGVTIVGIFISLIVVPSGGMLVYHTQLIWRNLTTNEHQNIYRYKYFQSKEGNGFHNPFDYGFFRNFMSRCMPGEESYIIFENDELFCENGGGGTSLLPQRTTINDGTRREIELTPQGKNSNEGFSQANESVMISVSEKISGGSGGGGAERRSAAKRLVSEHAVAAAETDQAHSQEMRSLL